MCYGTELIEFDDSFRRENERLRKRMQHFWKEEGQQRKRFYANAFTRPIWPIVTAEEPEEAQPMQWGLVPHWAKDAAAFLKKAPTYNAISETAYDKPSFRNAMAKGHRCLVPVTGFFEWHHIGKATFPHYIRLKGGGLFSLAGLYENGTYTILTCPANPLMEQVHNAKKRMPVILPMEQEDSWLQAGLTKEEVLAMCVPYPADDMETWTVGRGLTSRSEDPNTPQASVPVSYPELAGASWLHPAGAAGSATPG